MRTRPRTSPRRRLPAQLLALTAGLGTPDGTGAF
jgi:hypothetical protein